MKLNFGLLWAFIRPRKSDLPEKKAVSAQRPIFALTALQMTVSIMGALCQLCRGTAASSVIYISLLGIARILRPRIPAGVRSLTAYRHYLGVGDSQTSKLVPLINFPLYHSRLSVSRVPHFLRVTCESLSSLGNGAPWPLSIQSQVRSGM